MSPKNRAPSLLSPTELLTSCKISEKTNEQITKKYVQGEQKNELMDNKVDLY